jgi:hypothetical protein
LCSTLGTRTTCSTGIQRTVNGGKEDCDEYLYALGIVNFSKRPVSGCRVVLQASTPHNTSQQRLGKTMRVRNDPNPQSEGVFSVNPSKNGQPNVYVEVLHESVPVARNMSVPSDILLRYSNTHQSQPHYFSRVDHLVTFRLEGDVAEPVEFRMYVRYDTKGRRWRVEPA